MGKIVADFKTIFAEKLKDTSEKLTTDFKKFAEKSGWDPSLYGDVEVNASGISVPSSIKTKVEDAEYGGPEDRPKAAMRNFKPKIKNEFHTTASEAVVEALSLKAAEVFKK